MRRENFDVKSYVDLEDSEINDILVEKLADLIAYRLGVDAEVTGDAEKGFCIDIVEHGEIYIYPSNDYYEPDEWDYSEFHTESDYEAVVAEFEKEYGIELNAYVSTDF